MARALSREAERTRASVPPMLARVEEVRWQSAAAEAMRGRARECAGDLRRIASSYDAAAAAVRRHADHVEQELEELARVQRALESLGGVAGSVAREAIAGSAMNEVRALASR